MGTSLEDKPKSAKWKKEDASGGVKKGKSGKADKGGKSGKSDKHSKKMRPGQHRRQDDDKELEDLDRRVVAEAPRPGGRNLSAEDDGDKEVGGPGLTSQQFSELPISWRTLRGLEQTSFTKMTPIQQAAIPHALAGRDILGEAKTGSGKTLAFLVPLVELLYRRRWTNMDGLGALAVSPTRELAYQIFKVLTDVGAEHEFSAGCVIGGREISEEQKSVAGMNILVATPGRLLQHLDETPGFDASSLQMLVLDEADRILDFGFQDTVEHIVEHLPRDRQTQLFSATLHTSVHRLGRATLKSPEVVTMGRSVGESRTPDRLKQVYMVVPLEKKLDVLFSFLRSHSQKKMIVFVSSCKQVRFLYETLRRLKPGPAVMELHGRQGLAKRMLVFDEFTQKERAAALICTDIAARGVDFPAVDWVVQMDCPENVDSYIHRVGRTARYESSGKSAIFLLPSEQAFLTKLKSAHVDAKSIAVKQGKVSGVRGKLQALLASEPAVKHLAQKAFISYVRSVLLNSDKEVFDAKALPREEFALSLGLVSPPEMRQQDADQLNADDNPDKKRKNQSALQRLKDKIKEKKAAKKAGAGGPSAKQADDAEELKEDMEEAKSKKLTKWERNQKRIERTKAEQDAKGSQEAGGGQAQEEDDFLQPVEAAVDAPPVEEVRRKGKTDRLKLRAGGAAVGAQGQHTFFDQKGEKTSELSQIAKKAGDEEATKEGRQAFLAKVAAGLSQRDGEDAAVGRAKIQERHQKEKKKARKRRQDENASSGDDDDGPMIATLGGGSGSDGGSDGGGSRDSGQVDSGDESADEPVRPPAAKKAAPVASSRPTATKVAPHAAANDVEALEQAALSRLSGGLGGLFG